MLRRPGVRPALTQTTTRGDPLTPGADPPAREDIPVTPEQIRDHAERIIRSHVEDIEYGSIAEMLEAQTDGLPDSEADKVVRAVDDAIGHATVTITWPDATP